MKFFYLTLFTFLSCSEVNKNVRELVFIKNRSSNCGGKYTRLKVYITKENEVYINEIDKALHRDSIEFGLLSKIRDDSSLTLYIDKQAEWKYCYEVIEIANNNSLKINIKEGN